MSLTDTKATSELKDGDRVSYLATGGNEVFATVKSIPNNSTAWLHIDGTAEHDERGIALFRLTKLRNTEAANEKSPELSKIDNRVLGAGGAPTRATTLPEDPVERKNFPVASGVLDYFPDALVAISEISKAGNDQHNPGLPLRWTRSKSGDEADTCMRHFLQRGTLDVDGKRHTAKAAWRMLALLQKELEYEQSKRK